MGLRLSEKLGAGLPDQAGRSRQGIGICFQWMAEKHVPHRL